MTIDQEAYDLGFFNNFRAGRCTMFDDYAIAKATLEVIRNEVPGDIVELGCNVGESAKVIQNVIENKNSDKQLYVYDSFEGLPAPNKEKGDTWAEGALKTTKEDLIANFEKNGLKVPIIVEGWFKDIEILPEKISFAFFDGDFYDSIMDSFKKTWDRVSQFGLVAVHDYFARGLQGVKPAVDEFMSGKNYINWYAHKDQDRGNDILIIKKL